VNLNIIEERMNDAFVRHIHHSANRGFILGNRGRPHLDVDPLRRRMAPHLRLLPERNRERVAAERAELEREQRDSDSSSEDEVLDQFFNPPLLQQLYQQQPQRPDLDLNAMIQEVRERDAREQVVIRRQLMLAGKQTQWCIGQVW
jgi:hypothetical protein